MRCSFPTGPIALHIGSRVRERRAELGLSRGVVATAIRGTIEDLEDAEVGRSHFTADEIFELCSVLRVSPSWFFEGLL